MASTLLIVSNLRFARYAFASATMLIGVMLSGCADSHQGGSRQLGFDDRLDAWITETSTSDPPAGFFEYSEEQVEFMLPGQHVASPFPRHQNQCFGPWSSDFSSSHSLEVFEPKDDDVAASYRAYVDTGWHDNLPPILHIDDILLTDSPITLTEGHSSEIRRAEKCTTVWLYNPLNSPVSVSVRVRYFDEGPSLDELASLVAPRCSELSREDVVSLAEVATLQIQLDYGKEVRVHTFLSVFEEESHGLTDMDCGVAFGLLGVLFGVDPDY